MTTRNEMISAAIKQQYGDKKRAEGKAAARKQHLADFYGRRKGEQARAAKSAQIVAAKILEKR